MRVTIAVGFIGSLLVGCATSPENIGPAYVSPGAYESFSCEQLLAEAQNVGGKLEVASAKQSRARSGDTIGRNIARHTNSISFRR